MPTERPAPPLLPLIAPDPIDYLVTVLVTDAWMKDRDGLIFWTLHLLRVDNVHASYDGLLSYQTGTATVAQAAWEAHLNSTSAGEPVRVNGRCVEWQMEVPHVPRVV